MSTAMSRIGRTTIGRQFGLPRGPVGRLVGRFMARNNQGFNRWVVEELGRTAGDEARRVVDLGCGPGVGVEAALTVFADAELWGIDPSTEMIAQASKRNAEALSSGRLRVLRGDTSSLADLAPLDLAYAVHVLYFWHRPEVELAAIKSALRPGGALGLGYRLREEMPRLSQTSFPQQGHRLYDSDEQLLELLGAAGFSDVEVRLPERESGGRLAIAAA